MCLENETCFNTIVDRCKHHAGLNSRNSWGKNYTEYHAKSCKAPSQAFKILAYAK